MKGKPKFLTEFLCMDAAAWQCRKVFLLDAPKARELHALVKLNNDLYLYGG